MNTKLASSVGRPTAAAEFSERLCDVDSFWDPSQHGERPIAKTAQLLLDEMTVPERIKQWLCVSTASSTAPVPIWSNASQPMIDLCDPQ